MERYFLDPSGFTYNYVCRIVDILPPTTAEGVFKNVLEGTHMGI
jgi:hypothetical protein